MISVGVDGLEDLQKFLQDVAKRSPEALHTGSKNFMITVFNQSQRECPVDTGMLRESGHIDIGTDEVSITYSAPYAAAVHWGYKRHLILPVRRKWLRWEVGRIQRLSAHGPRKNAKYAFSKGHFVPRARAHSKAQPFLTVPFIRMLKRGDLQKAITSEMRKVMT